MARTQKSKLSGFLLIAAGFAFFVAAFTGKQHAFTALGVVFVMLGIGAVRRARNDSDHSSGPAA